MKKNNEAFILSGFIKSKTDIAGDVIMLNYFDESMNEIIDSIPINNNGFKIKGKIKGAAMCKVTWGKVSDQWDDENTIHFFLEPKNVSLVLDNDSILKAKVLGSSTQTQYEELNSLTSAIYLTLDPLIVKRNNLVEISKRRNDLSIKNEIDSINTIQKIKLQEIKDIRLRYVENNYKSYLSSYWLNYYFNELPVDYVKLQYSNFSKPVKNSLYALMILERLKKAESTVILEIGNKLPHFRLKDIKGTEISLGNFKKKNILIVFWASWCGPCREEMPFLKNLYKKYYSSKFDIISISLDTKEPDWLRALIIEKSQWTQLLDLKGFNSDLMNQLNIRAIPDYILINSEGVIVEKGISKRELGHKIDKLLLLH